MHIGIGTNSGWFALSMPPMRLNDNGWFIGKARATSNSLFHAVAIILGPSIIQQPTSKSVSAGSSVALSVVAAGVGSLSFQWWKGGTNLIDGGRVSGSSTANLIVSGVGVVDAG